LRLQRVDAGLARPHPVHLDACIDLGEQLPLGDGIADLDVQLLELPGHLRADVDDAARLERAGGCDRVLDVAVADRDDQRLILLDDYIGLAPVPNAGGDRGEHDDEQRIAAALAFLGYEVVLAGPRDFGRVVLLHDPSIPVRKAVASSPRPFAPRAAARRKLPYALATVPSEDPRFVDYGQLRTIRDRERVHTTG